MKAAHALHPDGSGEQTWELANDLAVYEALRPLLDPIGMLPDRELHHHLRVRPGDATFRAFVVKAEGEGSRCVDRIVTLDPCGCDDDVSIEFEAAEQQHGIFSRALRPVSRVLQRVLHSDRAGHHQAPRHPAAAHIRSNQPD
jgi:hypothetical protein